MGEKMEKEKRKEGSVGKISLKVYARSAEQEFPKDFKKSDTKTAWENENWEDAHPPQWGDWGWDNYSHGWHNEKDWVGDNTRGLTNEAKLADVIHIRRDTEKYGFVEHKPSGTIFIADNDTLDELEALKGMLIKTVIEERADVAEALHL